MKFYKYQALGNDYIIFDLITDKVVYQKFDLFLSYLSQGSLAQRRKSIGADGIITLTTGNKSPYRMVVLNQDGSRAEICGNGLRCLSMYIYKYLNPPHSIIIETDAGLSYSNLISLNRQTGIIENSFPRTSSELPSYLPEAESFPAKLVIGEHLYYFYLVSVGNPHAVLFVERPNEFDLSGFYFKACREHEFFCKVNLSIVNVQKEQIVHRIYERGVGETLSCGSASVAVFVVLNKLNKADNKITLKHRGGQLQVERRNDNIYLIGEAYEVFTGEISVPRF
ncbi:MAG: diaminopimelate epimerase [bacterium]